jgi:hypothetical protein
MTYELNGRDRSKALSGEPGKISPVVNVRVAEETRDGLRAVAGGPSVTRVARQALDDAQLYYVVWQQTFDGAQTDWVRLHKPMTLEQAQATFEQFKTTARALQFRRMQIRRGRDVVVKEWKP